MPDGKYISVSKIVIILNCELIFQIEFQWDWFSGAVKSNWKNYAADWYVAVNVYYFVSVKKIVCPLFLAKKTVEKYVHLLMLTESVHHNNDEAPTVSVHGLKIRMQQHEVH